MATLGQLVFGILLGLSHVFSAPSSPTPRVVLNAPSLETSDLRAIDGYVASGLPLFSNTHGFILHSGMRPFIVKLKDPSKRVVDGIEQPNPGYYRDLPSVIPQGFEGVASTSFLLGNPIPPSKFIAPTAGPVVSFQPPSIIPDQSQPQQQQQQLAQSSIRIENKLTPGLVSFRNSFEKSDQTKESQDGHNVNPIVVQTSEFESGLPNSLRNPFYRNEAVASSLAYESLPAPGEIVVQELDWETSKIRQGRVRDLLSGAGLI